MKMELSLRGEWRNQESSNVLYPLQTPPRGNNASISAKNARDNFKDYFMCEGAVDWQWDKC